MVEDTGSLTVFIGRFAPFHNAHKRIVDAALATAGHVAILVGSAHQARDTRNPFTYDERVEMIRGSYDPEELARLRFAPIVDSDYAEHTWIGDVRAAVRDIQASLGLSRDADVKLIGHAKDGTSYYLRKFPSWGSIGVDSLDEGLSATHLREFLLAATGGDAHDATLSMLSQAAPLGTVRVMASLLGEPAWDDLCESAAKEAQDRKPYAGLRFKPWFYTGDAVVVRSGHVLLIRRGGHPYKGLLAFPGGFVEYEENVEEAWLRELVEETGIAIDHDLLRACATVTREFSRPHRDPRGRVVTRATLVSLPDGDLPRVAAADDAKEAIWVPVEEIRREHMAFDHHAILQVLLADARLGRH